MSRNAIGALLACCAMSVPNVHAADFVCQPDVRPAHYTRQEQRLVDRFWRETLTYLEQYLQALETPTGRCLDSAEATIQTFDAVTGTRQARCIMRYRDIELLAKHLRAIIAEPDKAKACFDPQKDYDAFQLYTPSRAVQRLSPVSRWLDRPLLTDYYRRLGGEIGEAGLELNEHFVAVTARTDTRVHFSRDVSIKGLPTLWSSVGWIPFYAENPDAGSDRFRGGYLYAEVMGPWGNLRIKAIDGETVGAEIGMTVQLFDTSYPYHYHHPQEIYMTLTLPQCIDQNRYMVMHWDSEAFDHQRRDDGWTVAIDGSGGRWRNWFANQDPEHEWLTYFERNAIHAFHAREGCNQTIENSGLVKVWARSTAQDNEQSTRLCQSPQGGSLMHPGEAAVCELRDWAP